MIEEFAYPVVSVIVENDNSNKILIQQRKKEGLYRGCWELPQGRLRQNESIFSCAERELFEETGLFNLKLKTDILSIGKTSIINSQIFSIVGSPSYFAVYLVGKAEGFPNETDEAFNHRWVDNEETMDLINNEIVFPLNVEMMKSYWKYYSR